MVGRRLRSDREFVNQSLINSVPPSPFVDVKLRDRDQIVFFIDVQSYIFCNVSEQFLPIDKTRRNGKARAGKNRCVLVVQRSDERLDEGTNRIRFHNSSLCALSKAELFYEWPAQPQIIYRAYSDERLVSS